MSDDRQEVGPALFSPDRMYRYSLTREWDPALPKLQVVGVNPSTADETKLDNTLRRVRGFAKAWGMGGFVMNNLFAYRATKPEDMRAADDPVGPNNNWHLLEDAKHCALTLAAWGMNGDFLDRDRIVTKMLLQSRVCLVSLGTTKDGFPRHPLYVKKDRQPVPYKGRG